MRLTRVESHAQTRERLIEAARRLFVRHGYGGASLREIAEEAGHSQGAFYSNFPTKEAVLLELLRRHIEAEARQLADILVDDDRSADEVLADLEAWAEMLHADADWAMLAVELQLHANRSPAFAAEYRGMWEVHRAALGKLTTRLFMRLGRVPPAAPNELASGLMALANGLALQRVAIPPRSAGGMIMVFLRAIINDAAELKGKPSKASHDHTQRHS